MGVQPPDHWRSELSGFGRRIYHLCGEACRRFPRIDGGGGPDQVTHRIISIKLRALLHLGVIMRVRSCLTAILLLLSIIHPLSARTSAGGPWNSDNPGDPCLTTSGVELALDDTNQGVPLPDPIEIMAWVPPYAITECETVVESDFGECNVSDGLTRVGLQFWIPNSDGSISYQDLGSGHPDDVDVAWWRSWCTTNGIECLLTIYNNDGSWNWDLALSAFADNRATFVSALISEMVRLDLDGVDIDLEGDGDYESDRTAFDQFIHDLWVELDALGKVLTINSYHYIWNAPNQNWWADWVGEVSNIHSMGYHDLYEGGTGYQKYSFQQDAGYSAGYAGNSVLMGMPSWLADWGVSAGYGTSAQAHIQEVRYALTEPTGIAIWDLQLAAWQDSDIWCEIVALRELGSSDVFEGDATSPHHLILQNHPNPFNPVTRFDYALQDDCHVELSIYDIGGRRITTLINEFQSSGPKTVSWNADDLTSGVYFCRLSTGAEMITTQAVLLK